MVAGRPNAMSATSRTAVTPLAPNDGMPRDGGATDTRGGTAVTAEIPAVPVAPSYGVLLPDGSVWYPGSKRKLPAPTLLRVTVWVLAFLVAIAGAGLIVEHYHPSWLDPLRHVVGTPGAATLPVASTTQPTVSPKHPSLEKMVITSASGSSVKYSVPGRSYVLVVKTSRDCYVVVTSLPSRRVLYQRVIPGGLTERVSVPAGAATLEAYAGGSSLVVDSGGRRVGSIQSLTYAFIYTFTPTNS